LACKKYSAEEILNKILDVNESYKLDKILIAGGEPTMQKDLAELTKLLKDEGFYIMLSTNGYYLKDMLDKLEVDEIHIDLKAYDENKHIYLTSCSNRRVLECISYIGDNKDRFSFKVEIDTVLIPNIVDLDEIEKIAKFLSNWDLPYRITGYVRYNNELNAEPPSKEKILKAKEIALKYLSNVSCSLDFRRHRKSKKVVI
jgi:pyruvate formate lyase activating enzyme